MGSIGGARPVALAFSIAISGCGFGNPLVRFCKDPELGVHVTFTVRQVDSIADALKQFETQEYLQDLEFHTTPGSACKTQGGSALAYGALPRELGGSGRLPPAMAGALMVLDKSKAARGVWSVVGTEIVVAFPGDSPGLLMLILPLSGSSGDWRFTVDKRVRAQGTLVVTRAE